MALPAAADGQEVRSVQLAWERANGAEGCADGDAIRRGVEARLGRSVFVDFGEPADARVRGRVAPASEGPGFVATLELDSDGTPRVRRVPTTLDDCRALDRTVVLLVSMFIDPDTPLTEEESDSARRLADQEPGEAGPTDEPTAAPAAGASEAPTEAAGSEAAGGAGADEAGEGSTEGDGSEGPGWGGRFWVGAAGVAGPTPTVTGGPRLGLGLVPPAWPSLELSFAYLVGTEAARGDDRISLSLVTATLAVCPRFYGDELFAFDGCADVQGGFFAAIAAGPADARTELRPWLALGARLRAVLRFAPWFVALAAGAHVPLWRDRFGFDQGGGFVTVHEPFPVGATAQLGVGFER